jgi:Phytanoyl-CoA dioxygenase (PhyH)
VPRAAFDETGIIRIPGAFGAREAARMRDVVWNELRGRYGIRRQDPSTWRRHPTGLKSTKRSPAFAPICGPSVAAALDAVLGAGRWRPPKHYGNVLVTMPDVDEWRVPHRIWHSDFPPTLPRDRVTVVKLWALFDDVEPGGGGTPQLAGSHLAFARHLARTGEHDYKRAKLGFLGSHPWLKALTRDDGDPRRNERLTGDGAEVDGIRLRVVECTGRAGDVYITHPWVFHSIASNASARPRLMRSVAVWASAPES